MNTLTYDVTVVTLPDDMAWPDEFTWRAVEQKTSYGVTGALFVESALKLAGRTIELQADASALTGLLQQLQDDAERAGA